MNISVTEKRLGIYSINAKAIEISEKQVLIEGTKEQAVELKKVLGSEVMVEFGNSKYIRITSKSELCFDNLNDRIVVFILVDAGIKICF